MKNITINENEYQEILIRLTEIENEEKLLKNIPTKSCHVDLPETFQELLIHLKRENNAILEQLIFYSKKLAMQLHGRMNYQDLFNFIISGDIPTELHLNQTFLDVWPTIKELLEMRKANDYLFHYVNQLDQEKNLLLTQKNKYEKELRNIQKSKTKKRSIFPKK